MRSRKHGIALRKRLDGRLRATPRRRPPAPTASPVAPPAPRSRATITRAGPASRPSADPSCHTGRLIANPIAREMARALGVVTCPECHRTIAVNGRHGTILRPHGAGWSEPIS